MRVVHAAPGRGTLARNLGLAAILLLLFALATPIQPIRAATGDITEYRVSRAGFPIAITPGPDGNLWFLDAGGVVGKVTTFGTVTEYTIPTAPPAGGAFFACGKGSGGGPPGQGITPGPDGNLWFTEAVGKVGKVTTSGTLTEYTIPTANSFPEGIARGPDGNLWFTEAVAGKVGKVTTSGTFTEYSLPTAGSYPSGIAAGPDGNLWFTESSMTVGKVAKVTTSGTFTEYSLPTAGSYPSGIAAGPDGNLWFTESAGTGDTVGKVTTSGTFTEYPLPTASFGLQGIAAGLDGNLWFTEVFAGKVGKVTTSGTFTEYVIPGAFSGPLGISAGPDGNLWFTEWFAAKVGNVTTSGTFTEYPIPSSGSPSEIASGPDGNLWFTEYHAVGRLTTSGVITHYRVPSGSPSGITAGPDGNLWFTESYMGKVGKVTTSGTITEYSVPTANTYPFGITAGPDGNLWFTESGSVGEVVKVTTSGTFTEYPIPTASGGPGGIAAGPDGNLWFTEAVGKVGKVTTSGTFTEYTIPTTNSGASEITAGPDGNLWFTELCVNKVASVTTSGTFSEYTIPTATSHPQGIALGPDRNLWFTEGSGNKVSSITTLGTFTEYTVPTAVSVPSGITAGPDGNMWFTEALGSKVAKLIIESKVALVLPALSNGAYGGFVTSAYIQNVGTAPASVNIRYLDQNGLPVGTGDAVTNLPPNATWIVSQSNGHSFASGQAGSAIVMSNQPLAGFVNEFAPGGGDATSYTGVSPVSGVGTTLYAPTIANNAYGGYTTGIGLMNTGTVATNLTITYRNGMGSVVKTQTLNGVAAGAYQGLYSGDAGLGLPPGFAGTATLQSSAGNVAAVVNEIGPGGQFSSYDAVPTGSTTLDAPVALNNAFGGYNTGMGIQNTTGSAGTVTINYYDASGTATTKTFPIAAYGSLGVYQGTDIPVPGAYTAKLTSTVPIAAIVNEVAPSTTIAKQSTAYNTFAAGSSSLHLPLVESAGPDGWSTGEGIMNTGTAATTVTVTYNDTVTGVQVGTPQSQSLQPNAFWGLYQPTGGLPNGMRASAVVTTAAGGQVAVICNEANATSFMSYIGT